MLTKSLPISANRKMLINVAEISGRHVLERVPDDCMVVSKVVIDTDRYRRANAVPCQTISTVSDVHSLGGKLQMCAMSTE